MKLLLGDCLDDVPSQQIWEECMRVLKPGGHLLAFSGSRTYHRMAVRIEDAGFEIRDMISWLYGSGFPKSMDISKQIDKKAGVEREVVGKREHPTLKDKSKLNEPSTASHGGNEWVREWDITTPATDEAKNWEGWGTSLKPAHEPIVMARKPLEENTVVDNVLKWGTGGINIDESRIGVEERTYKGMSSNIPKTAGVFRDDNWTPKDIEITVSGRFPANLILDEEAGKMLDEQTGVLNSGFLKAGTARLMSDNPNKNTYGKWNPDTVANDTYGDSGGASRFFYCPKVSKSERNEGLDGFGERRAGSMMGNINDNSNFLTGSGNKREDVAKNHHPTVKPVDLMIYLIRLVTPKGGVTLDPFMGSGSSGKAAVRGGFDFIGIEREEEYYQIAEARIEYEKKKPIIVKTPTGKKVEIKREVEEIMNKFFS